MNYNQNDFINIYDYKDAECPFQIFIGGRGIGKTYSALHGALNGECKDKFILMRRTAKELKLLLDSKSGEGVNPFKEVNRQLGTEVGLCEIVEDLAGIYNREVTQEGRLLHIGQPIGYGVSLSTIANIRGTDFSDCSDLIYDEFIPEKHVRKIKNECDALFNAYETINRNREFIGKPPVNVWLLSNSDDIYNPIFVGLRIVSEIEKMVRKGISHKKLQNMGLAIHILKPLESFIEKKQNTALYKLTANTKFAAMALDNDFAYNDFSLIAYRKLQGYIPLCAIDNAYIYSKKGERNYYVTYAPAKCQIYNTSEAQDVIKFKQKYGGILYQSFVDRKISFESYEIKEKILAIIF